jgi:DNA adenine methylase
MIIDPYRNVPIEPFPNHPPLVRMGGKRYLAEKLVGIIDSLDYSMYVEPFFGGGRVYFEKQPHFEEIINDKASLLANFYYCGKRFAPELEEQQNVLCKDENEFFRLYDLYHNEEKNAQIRQKLLAAQELYDQTADEGSKAFMVQHAIQFFFYSNMAYRGSLTARTMTYFENDPRTEKNRLRYRIFRPLTWVGERMRRTEVLGQDFTRVFKIALKYQNHTRVWFIDPPYLGVEGYEDEVKDFPWERYEELNTLLMSLPRTDYFLLTLNIKPEFEALFQWCHIETVSTHYTTGGTGQNKKVEEYLITPPWNPVKKNQESAPSRKQCRLDLFVSPQKKQERSQNG